jgi:HEAT repeat protein
MAGMRIALRPRLPVFLGLFLCTALLPCGVLLPTDAVARDEEAWEARLAALVERLESFDEEVWRGTRAELQALGARAVPILTRSLSSSHEQVRRRAAQALEAIGAEAVGAGAALAENLLDDSLAVRTAAATALGHVDPERAVAHLAPLLESARSQEDRHALWKGLAAAGAIAAPVMRTELMQGAVYRRALLSAVSELGAGAAPLLCALIADESWHIRLWGLDATRTLKEISPSLVETIAQAGSDETEAVAVAATARMALAIPDEPAFVPYLARLCVSGRVGVRRAATFGLARISTWDSSLVVPLLTRIEDADEGVRVNAARGLVLFPEDYREEARAALRARLRDEQPSVRIAASWSLLELGDRSAAPAPGLIMAVLRYGGIPAPFTYYLRSNDLLIGGRKRFDMVMPLHGAAKALLKVGPDAIPVLEAAAIRLEEPRRVMLVYALAGMGADAIPALERLLAGPDELLRNIAACCLGTFGAKGRAAIPILVPLASRDDPYEPLVIKAGDDSGGEIVGEEGEDYTQLSATSWIRESRDALLSIGAPALPALRAASDADPEVALRLAPVIAAIQAGADRRPPR